MPINDPQWREGMKCLACSALLDEYRHTVCRKYGRLVCNWECSKSLDMKVKRTLRVGRQMAVGIVRWLRTAGPGLKSHNMQLSFWCLRKGDPAPFEIRCRRRSFHNG